MTSTSFFKGVSLLTILLCLLPPMASAQTGSDCGDATPLTHEYPSGARWSLCAELHPKHGLHLTQLRYQTPGGNPRLTFREIHLAGLLEHWHDASEERSVFDDSAFGDQNVNSFTENTCPGETFDAGPQENVICTHHYPHKILAKFDATDVVQGHSWEVITAASNGRDQWEVVVIFGEEGTLSPSLYRAGILHRFTEDSRYGSSVLRSGDTTETFAVHSTVNATWRIVPGFEASENIQVQQFDFELRSDLASRRPMRISNIDTESFAQVDRERFRGWRMMNENGAGYYLDPQNNGFQFTSRRYNWALFDIGFSRYESCEQSTLGNSDLSSECAPSPVVWFSQSFPITPNAADIPLLRTRSISFDLMPFDWTLASPFAPTGDGS